MPSGPVPSSVSVTCTLSLLPPPPDTANKYSYKVFPYGGTPENAEEEGPFAIIPWTTETTTFTTSAVAQNGLYRVWVQVQNDDGSSSSEAQSDASTPFAVGERRVGGRPPSLPLYG